MKAYLIGGDSREKYLAYRLERKGIEILHPEQVGRLKDKRVEMILLPMPVTMDHFTVKATEGQKKVNLKEVLEITEKGIFRSFPSGYPVPSASGWWAPHRPARRLRAAAVRCRR